MVLVLLGKKLLLGVPQGSDLAPFLFHTHTHTHTHTHACIYIYIYMTHAFFIYINGLPHDISSICKTFPNDTLLFSKVKDHSLSLILTLGLETINQSTYQWKMSFNANSNK